MLFCLGKNRDRQSIIAAILETANSGANKTRIMFGANLSFKLLDKYLDLVVCNGFVQVHDSLCLLTETSRDFLRQYGNFHDRYAKAQELNEGLGSK